METKTRAESVASELDGHAYPDPRCTAVSALLALVRGERPQAGAGPHHELLARCGLVALTGQPTAWDYREVIAVTPFGREVAAAILRASAPHRTLRPAELTRAVARYAKRYGYYRRTVRDVTSLRFHAVREYLAAEATRGR